MSTRSNIGIINRDGSVEMIYCHSDGYPSWNGKILLENYSNEDKIRELMALGAISSLGPEIGEKHNFDDYKVALERGWTRAYGRDRGEKDVDSMKRLTVSKALNQMECYLYLWDCKTNTWLYTSSAIYRHRSRFYVLTPKRCESD